MESLVALLSPFIANQETLRLVVISLAGGTVAILGMGIAYLVYAATDPVRKRLDDISVRETISDGDPEKGLLVKFETMLGPVAQYVLPADEIERSKIRAQLTHAGFRQPNAVQQFYSLKTVLIIGLPIVIYLSGLLFPQVSSNSLLLYSLIGAGVGLLLPNMVLDRLVLKRQKKIRDGFPDALDLLVVCVEAGLGLTQALQRVADELIVSHPELSSELSLVNAEVRAGVDRINALKSLSARTGLEDVRGLTSLLIQALRFGTGIADSLRVYAEEFRDKRMQKAEELAAKVGTKMIFPLVIFMFPAFFVVAIGPAAIRLIAVFGQMGNN